MKSTRRQLLDILLIYPSFIVVKPFLTLKKANQKKKFNSLQSLSSSFIYQIKAFFPKKIITMNFQYFIFFLASFGFCFFLSFAEFPYFKQSLKDDGSLSFLVIGDWGRKGLYNQSEVALQVLHLSFSLFLFIYFVKIIWFHGAFGTKKNIFSENKWMYFYFFCVW